MSDLLFDVLDQMRQFSHGAFDLAPGVVEVRRTHQRGPTG
jgi:hypothetical protein